MKRSTNFSHTRAARSYLADTALFLRDLGMTDDGIKLVIGEMRTGKDEPSNNGVQPTAELAGLEGFVDKSKEERQPAAADA